VITDTILNVINAVSPAYNYLLMQKNILHTLHKDSVNLLYNFIGINGTYGAGVSK
jgi:hypothetical protein